MIKTFESYKNGKLLESSLERTESQEICIDLNDYREEYDNIFKDRYRNLETGDVFKLKDLLKGHFGVWITKSPPYNSKIKETKFEIIKGWDCDIEEIENNKGKFIVMWKNKLDREMNLRKIETSKGQDRMWARFSSKRSNMDKFIIPANRIIMYNISDYLKDIHEKIFGNPGNITIRGTKDRSHDGKDDIVTIPRVISLDVFYNSLHVISDKTDTKKNMWGQEYLSHDNYYLDITRPIYSKRIQWFDAEFDPYGEEDWDD